MLLSSHSVVSHPWQPHGLQHASSLSPRDCSNSCPLNRWHHSIISSSVTLFSSCLQSFPASGSFQMSQLFASDGLRIGASASTSVLPMNIKGWFPLGLTGLISLQSKGLSRVFSNTTVLKHQFFSAQPSLWSNSHIHTWLLEKPSSWPHLNLIAPQRSHFQILSSWGLGFQYMNFEEPQILSPSQNPVDLRQHQDSLIYQCPYFWSTTATTISYCYLLLV